MSATLQHIQPKDGIGIPKFQIQQAKAMVEMVRRTGRLNSTPPEFSGKGIVIAGGGKYLSHAWVGCQILREKVCQLPIQVWHLGEKEMPRWARPHFAKLEAEPVDAYEVMRKHPIRQMSGWVLKNYAIRHCPWEQVLFLDADCLVTENPEPLMTEFESTGGLFFSDIANHAPNGWAWVYCGLQRLEKEWEAGQYIVNKRIGWMGLQWSLWFGEHSDVWGKMVHGDKTWTELAWRVSGAPHVVSIECEWKGWGISQQWQGKEWFRHCMAAKRGEHPWPEDAQRRFWEWQTLAMGR
jgi:putative mannosyltransferase